MSIYLCIWCEQTCSFSNLRDVATRSIQIIHYFHSPSTNFDSIRNANIFILNPLLFMHLWIMDNTLNTTFNDISVILRSQFYLLGKTGLPEKKTPSCGKSSIFLITICFIEYTSLYAIIELSTSVVIIALKFCCLNTKFLLLTLFWLVCLQIYYYFFRSKLHKMTSSGILCPSPIYSKPSTVCCPQSPGMCPQMAYGDVLSYFPYSLAYNNLFMLQEAYSTPQKTGLVSYLPTYHDNSSPVLDLSTRAHSCSSPEVASDDSLSPGMYSYKF